VQRHDNLGHPMLSRTASALFVLLAASIAVLYLRGLPYVRELPGWFYRPIASPVGPAFALLAAGVAPVVVIWAVKSGREGKHFRALFTLVITGAVVMFTLHFIVPAGLEHMFERLHVGHGEFLRVAASRRGQLLTTLRDYDALFAQAQIGAFAGSKPPGTLGIYMVCDALAQLSVVQWLLGPMVAAARASRFVAPVAESAALLAVLFPLLTALTTIPLVVLAKRFLGDVEAAYATALVFLSSPSILLIDLHLDGALFPLLTVSSLACTVLGAQARRPWIALASGAIATMGVYCSFGLLPVPALATLLAAVVAVQPRLDRDSPEAARSLKELFRERGRELLPSAWVVVGTFATLLVLVGLLDFKPLRRFEDVLAFHTAWKGGVPTALWRKLSLVEFGLYASAPLLFALLAEAVRSLRDLLKRTRVALSIWCITVAALLGVLAARQGTNEVARLWLFMIPLMALAAAGGLTLRAPDAAQRRSWIALASSQAALAVILRVTQPW
jgi:hypothetical protein